MALTIKGGTVWIALCWEMLTSICPKPWLNCDSISTEHHLQGLRVCLLLRAVFLVPNSKRNQDKDESHYLCQQGNLMAAQICIFIISWLSGIWHAHVCVTLLGLWKSCFMNLLIHLKGKKYKNQWHLVVDIVMQINIILIPVFWQIKWSFSIK